MPINEQVSLNARLGIARWDVDVNEIDSAFPGVNFDYSDSGTDLYYGLGGQFKLNNHLSIGIEYTILPIEATFDGDTIDHKVDNIACSLSYSF